MKTCASEDLECYVLDNNGFVMISETKADTGKFFGEVDGTILESLVQVRKVCRVWCLKKMIVIALMVQLS